MKFIMMCGKCSRYMKLAGYYNTTTVTALPSMNASFLIWFPTFSDLIKFSGLHWDECLFGISISLNGIPALAGFPEMEWVTR